MNIILRRRGLGYPYLRELAGRMEEPVTVIRNDRGIPDRTQLAIRWGTTSTVPTSNVINSAQAIHLANDKRRMRLLLDERGIGSFNTYGHINEYTGGYPAIVRKHTHSMARHLHLCQNDRELRRACSQYNSYYISPYIDKTAEYRVFCAQGRVVCVANKIPGSPDDVAWNVHEGGSFENVRWGDWNLRAIRIGLEAFNESGLDFGGVDVMVDAQNNVYVLEINSAPSLTSEYRQECFANVFDYMIRNGTEPIPLIEDLGGWRKFIHPAKSDEALIP